MAIARSDSLNKCASGSHQNAENVPLWSISLNSTAPSLSCVRVWFTVLRALTDLNWFMTNPNTHGDGDDDARMSRIATCTSAHIECERGLFKYRAWAAADASAHCERGSTCYIYTPTTIRGRRRTHHRVNHNLSKRLAPYRRPTHNHTAHTARNQMSIRYLFPPPRRKQYTSKPFTGAHTHNADATVCAKLRAIAHRERNADLCQTFGINTHTHAHIFLAPHAAS